VIQATTRYRLPLEPFLIVLAASAMVDLFDRYLRRAPRPSEVRAK
jgi:hypothetical protein